MTRLSRPLKVFVGALTLWPFLYMFIFIGTAFFAVLGRGARPGGDVPTGFALLFVAHLLTMLLLIVLTAFYLVFLFKTPRVAADKKALWAVVLFLGNVFAMPIFFWFYVWPDDTTVPVAS